MKAVIFKGVGKPLAVETADDPAPATGQVVLKVARCGICGTDLHSTSDHGRTLPAGSKFGHEFSGEIVELGKGVTNVNIGDRVTAIPMIGCGVCPECLVGEPFWCSGEKPSGKASGFAEYTLAGAPSCLKLPDSVSLQDAALVEPLACGLHAVKRAGMKKDARIMTLGAGPIGLATIYWARKLGAGPIVAVAASERRKQHAMSLGANYFLTNNEELERRLNEILGGQPDIVFECVGQVGSILKSIELVKPRGKIVALGFCTMPETFTPAEALLKEVSIIFAIVYSMRDFEQCVDALNAGAPELSEMVTSVVSLKDFPSAFEALRGRNSECKVMLAPSL